MADIILSVVDAFLPSSFLLFNATLTLLLIPDKRPFLCSVISLPFSSTSPVFLSHQTKPDLIPFTALSFVHLIPFLALGNPHFASLTPPTAALPANKAPGPKVNNNANLAIPSFLILFIGDNLFI